VYAIDFEGKFLETSEDFYNLEGQNLVAKCDAPEYMKKVWTWREIGETDKVWEKVLGVEMGKWVDANIFNACMAVCIYSCIHHGSANNV